MKTLSTRYALPILISLGSAFLVSTVHATGQSRAEFLNITSAQAETQLKNPWVAFSGGGLVEGPGSIQTGSVVLQQCSFGQAFSQWYPSSDYGTEIVTNATNALYPNLSEVSTRAAIEGTPESPGKPFRYKFLLYGEGGDVSDFDADQLEGWFTQSDRDRIAIEIGKLKEAVAASPLDTSIRNTLLDIYYDLAVAEMQTIKPKLAQLARFHLGIDLLDTQDDSGNFAIDKEIEVYEEITTSILESIKQYKSLFSDRFEGIDPSSLDSKIPFGTISMGRYIFQREQPRRSSVASKFADQSGVQEVPTKDDAGNLIPAGNTLFVGYKDLNTLLQIIGQRQQHLANLVKLLGTRKAPGDLVTARQHLSNVAGEDVTQLQLIKSWFPELFPTNLAALSEEEQSTVEALLMESGVLASNSAIELGRVDLANMASRLNGIANPLGFDPNFLLLAEVRGAQNNAPPVDSYDYFVEQILDTNGPLRVALDKLGDNDSGAIGAYQSFQQNVDRVIEDIDDEDSALADRFFEITGFEANGNLNNANPPELVFFDLTKPNPTPGSELGAVFATIRNLEKQAEIRKRLTDELNTQFSEDAAGLKKGVAQEALDVALQKELLIAEAAQRYKDQTSPYYDEMIGLAGGAAASQASYDAVSAVADNLGDALTGNPLRAIGGSASAATIAVAGAINVSIQTAAAVGIGRQEQNLDYAAIDFTTTNELNDTAFLINQATQQLSAIKREQVSNQLEEESDRSALSQANAQASTLTAELTRIVTKRDSNVNSIRKRSYADPLHYRRAEAALIAADESFRVAQTWMFYTMQALNYKWTGRFAKTIGAKSYDSSSIFKSRNATELNDLLVAMTLWDLDRETQTNVSPRIISVISLSDHVLAPNPNRADTDPTDRGVRSSTADPTPLPTLEFFRKRLKEEFTSGGFLEIPFSTIIRSQGADQIDGTFFRGAIYKEDGGISPGFWLEKIEYVKVNIVLEDSAPRPSTSLAGSLSYGGTTLFHTRIPPREDRSVGGGELSEEEAPGEILSSTFRYFVSPNFDTNFEARSEKLVDIAISHGGPAVIFSDQGNAFDRLDIVVPEITSFANLSIAAEKWALSVKLLNGTFLLNIDQIKDIEIIIAYRNSPRIVPSNS